MTTYEVLEKALALIEREENWTQGCREDFDGRVCAVGALEKAIYGEIDKAFTRGIDPYVLGGPLGIETLAIEQGGFPGTALSDFNDSHSHAEVCNLFRKAIRKAKADAGVPVEIPAEERTEANV